MHLENFTVKSSLKDYKVTYGACELDSFVDVSTDFLLVDRVVYHEYGDLFRGRLPNHRLVLIDAREQNKTAEYALQVIRKIMKVGITKKSRILAFGGGIVQDLSGFVSSILYRGISWIFFPTTLLAQTDSCIGAKTSINLGAFKNLLGTFYNPTQVQIDVTFLDTLSIREYFSGMGEVVKLHLIGGQEFITSIQSFLQMLLERQRDSLLGVIHAALQIKKGYIEQDEFDRGIRNLLNYGHCIGHAIEFSSKFKIPHGQAVSIGMILANRIARKRGELSESRCAELEGLIESFVEGALARIRIPITKTIDAMKRDKKRTGKNLVVIYLSDVNGVVKNENVTVEEVTEILHEWNGK